MSLRITDSEPPRYEDLPSGSEVLTGCAVSLDLVPPKKAKPDAVSQYLQMRIDRLYDDGKGMDLVDIAKAVGVGKSQPSQVRSGELGVAAKAIGKYAKYFQFENADALREAAYDWWLSRRRQKVRGMTVAMRAAREEMIRFKRATAAEIDDVLDAFSHDRFRSRDVDWWTDTIARELREDRPRRRPDLSDVETPGPAPPRRSATGASR